MTTLEIRRSVPFQLARADEGGEGDGHTLEGYAATFDTPTLIDSWEGTFYERIRKGAFRKTIRENTPVLQFDHGHHRLIGSIPIGKIEELSEDDEGLHVLARLSDNWLIDPVRQAIAEGSITGMSFRFTVIRDVWRDVDGKVVKPDELGRLLWDAGERGPLERELVEVRCHELGPVVFPAYASTSVGVRARAVAEHIRGDDAMRREVLGSLARHAAAPRTDDDLSDPELRREVAAALLFGSQISDRDRESEQDTEVSTPVEDAPPPVGHPSRGTDAPPLDGHPSANPTPSRSEHLRGQIREITALMGQVLAPIDKDT